MLKPVSCACASSGTGPTFYKVDYDAKYFTPNATGASANTDYLVYGFAVKCTNGGSNSQTVTITPTWSDSSSFCYALIQFTAPGESSATNYILNASGSYVPVTALASDAEIDDDNGSVAAVIDAGDGTGNGTVFDSDVTTGTMAATGITTGDSTHLTFTVASGTDATANVKVFIWAEGQDANCTGTVSQETAKISFAIA
jgi:hypothetical protein